MKTIEDNYGIGLFKYPFVDKTNYGHSGEIDGFTSTFSHFSTENISYALTSNGTNINNNDISIVVLSAIFNEPYKIPQFTSYELNSKDLDEYLGVYSSEQIPLKITVTKKNRALIAQATGQSSFPLEATAKDQFTFDKAGIVLEFNPEKNGMILNQGGGQYIYTKE